MTEWRHCQACDKSLQLRLHSSYLAKSMEGYHFLLIHVYLLRKIYFETSRVSRQHVAFRLLSRSW